MRSLGAVTPWQARRARRNLGTVPPWRRFLSRGVVLQGLMWVVCCEVASGGAEGKRTHNKHSHVTAPGIFRGCLTTNGRQ